ncbi:MAG: GNAT family N-acetyltransferase [Kofleriaceae bacterium]
MTDYRRLCATEPSIPLFCRDYWLDAVAPGAWDAVMLESGGTPIGAWPFVRHRRLGFDYLQLPLLTQFLGPWISYPAGQKQHSRLSHEKEVFTALIERLPAHDYLIQNCHHSITNWLPFYWRGFAQTTRYTYVLDDLRDPEAVFAAFRSNIKTDIKKARKAVTVVVSEDLDRFYAVNRLTFARQDTSPPYSLELLRRLDGALAARGQRRILLAVDAAGAVHAGVYLVWDEHTAYYLMSGGDPALRSSGATSLLVWEAIQHAATVARSFDFEGSMMEPVERFIRAFGAAQRPYSQLTHVGTRKMQLRLLAEQVLGRR